MKIAATHLRRYCQRGSGSIRMIENRMLSRADLLSISSAVNEKSLCVREEEGTDQMMQ